MMSKSTAARKGRIKNLNAIHKESRSKYADSKVVKLTNPKTLGMAVLGDTTIAPKPINTPSLLSQGLATENYMEGRKSAKKKNSWGTDSESDVPRSRGSSFSGHDFPAPSELDQTDKHSSIVTGRLASIPVAKSKANVWREAPSDFVGDRGAGRTAGGNVDSDARDVGRGRRYRHRGDSQGSSDGRPGLVEEEERAPAYGTDKYYRNNNKFYDDNRHLGRQRHQHRHQNSRFHRGERWQNYGPDGQGARGGGHRFEDDRGYRSNENRGGWDGRASDDDDDDDRRYQGDRNRGDGGGYHRGSSQRPLEAEWQRRRGTDVDNYVQEPRRSHDQGFKQRFRVKTKGSKAGESAGGGSDPDKAAVEVKAVNDYEKRTPTGKMLYDPATDSMVEAASFSPAKGKQKSARRKGGKPGKSSVEKTNQPPPAADTAGRGKKKNRRKKEPQSSAAKTVSSTGQKNKSGESQNNRKQSEEVPQVSKVLELLKMKQEQQAKKKAKAAGKNRGAEAGAGKAKPKQKKRKGKKGKKEGGEPAAADRENIAGGGKEQTVSTKGNGKGKKKNKKGKKTAPQTKTEKVGDRGLAEMSGGGNAQAVGGKKAKKGKSRREARKKLARGKNETGNVEPAIVSHENAEKPAPAKPPSAAPARPAAEAAGKPKTEFPGVDKRPAGKSPGMERVVDQVPRNLREVWAKAGDDIPPAPDIVSSSSVLFGAGGVDRTWSTSPVVDTSPTTMKSGRPMGDSVYFNPFLFSGTSFGAPDSMNGSGGSPNEKFGQESNDSKIQGNNWKQSKW
jgi:hypothetical protein